MEDALTFSWFHQYGIVDILTFALGENYTGTETSIIIVHTYCTYSTVFLYNKYRYPFSYLFAFI